MAHRRRRRLVLARTPLARGAAVVVALILLLALVAPLVWGEAAAAVDTDAIQQGPSSGHLLGTDALGRDVLARVLVATRLSLGLSVLATTIGVVIGTLLGAAPTVLPRWAGRLVTAAVNIAVAFPGLLLALFLAVVFGVGTTGAVLAIGFAGAPAFARLTQTLAASVAERDYVAAARVAGVGRLRILVRHVLPNIGEPLVVNATIGAGGALLAFAGLSFLGIGVQAPSYDWGRLLNEGLARIYTNPAAALGPGVAVVLAGLAFNLLGEAAAAAVGQRNGIPRPPGDPTVPAQDATAPNAPGDRDSTTGAEGDDADVVLRVEDLTVRFPTDDGWVTPVRGVSFSVRAGEAVGVVGESGSGKSLTALAVSRLVEEPGQVRANRLEFTGVPLLQTPERDLRHLLGTSLAMVFQDPATSFNPTRRMGRQLAEVAEEHQGLDRRTALARAVDKLQAVRIPAAARRARQYPHEFSGGMRQRAMIGMGLMGRPRLVVADEPTTALDVTVQREVLRLLASVRTRTRAAVILISHDITVVSQTCDRVLVMYAGRVVEDLPAAQLHSGARHPYTRALLAVVPDLQTDRAEPLGAIPGRPPEPGAVPAGCAFAPRCGFASEQCRTHDPLLGPAGRSGSAAGASADPSPGHRVACWHPVDEAAPAPRTPAEGALQVGGQR